MILPILLLIGIGHEDTKARSGEEPQKSRSAVAVSAGPPSSSSCLRAFVANQDEAAIEREVKVANNKDRPQLHGQAAKRLRDRGAAAVAPAILAYVEKNGANGLSLSGTDVLGHLKDPRITALLRSLVADRQFFWRPAAMRALALHADPGARDVFREGLSDKLWGVRMAAVLGVEKIGDRDSMPRLKEMLGDEVYDVRAQAAKTLHAFGDPSGLPVLVEALRADTVWFDIDYGQIAREDAWNFLKTITKDDFGYKPWEGPEQRAPGLAKFEAWIAGTMPDWKQRVPEKARVRAEKVDYAFGYELRSCQLGDFFLRVEEGGRVVFGYFNLERVTPAPEELRALHDAIAQAKAVDRSVPYGEGGCDFEQFHFKKDGRFEKLWIGQKGRPLEVEPFVKAVEALVKRHLGERAAADYRQSALLFRAEE